MAINSVPEKLINFRVYKNDAVFLGVADCELPEVEAMSESVSGSGIAGEFESPVLGHIQSMSCKIKFRTTTRDVVLLNKHEAHLLTFRSAMQQLDAADGVLESVPNKCVMKVLPKKGGLGKLEAGKPMDSEFEGEVIYLKLTIDDQELLEIDKLNCIYKVDGEDQLQTVRTHLGMES